MKRKTQFFIFSFIIIIITFLFLIKNKIFFYHPKLIAIEKIKSIEKNQLIIKQKEYENKLDTLIKYTDNSEKENFIVKRKVFTVKYGAEIAHRLLSNAVWLGMTSEMAEDEFGKPDRISKSISPGHIKEQWIYNVDSNQIFYLHFDNGMLVNWQS